MHLNSTLSKKILAWYDNSKRDLPWRVSKKSPKKLYYRLLSEFMLQQTQVKTVLPYFKKFTKKFPTLESLSKSNEKQILKMWEGLGYYRRARNLYACSNQLINLYKGKLPKTLDEIKKLPGIGDYTGNALLGLVYDQPRIAVDGNVKRVFARNLNKKEAKIDFNKLVNSNSKMLFNNKRNADFVEALMEFGALICKPKDPKCFVCCLNKTCKYLKSSKIGDISTLGVPFALTTFILKFIVSFLEIFEASTVALTVICENDILKIKIDNILNAFINILPILSKFFRFHFHQFFLLHYLLIFFHCI